MRLSAAKAGRKAHRPCAFAHLWRWNFVCILAALGTSNALASELPDDKRFLVAPYFWIATVDGDVGLGPLSVPISMGIGDLLNYTEYGAMGYLQWNFHNGFLFADGSVAGSDTKAFEPFFNQPLQADFRALETGYGRHFVIKRNSQRFREFLISPHIGVLHAGMKGEVSGLFDMEFDYAWTGLTVGVTASAPIDDRFTLTVRSVHSGFHGDLNDFVNALIAVRYRCNDRVALGLGYRIAKVEYASGDSTVDVDLKGVMLGVELSW